MTEGFVPDEGYGTRKLLTWVEGQPKKSIWSGISLRGRRQITIRTLRCGRCGFLENYAAD